MKKVLCLQQRMEKAGVGVLGIAVIADIARHRT